MSDLKFSIEFYKIRPKIHLSKKIQDYEKHEVAEKALDFVEILIYFITETAKTQELDTDSADIYFSMAREIVFEFLHTAQSNLNEIKELQSNKIS